MVAVKETGTYDSLKDSWVTVFGEAKLLAQKSKVDDAVDADGDGIPDMQQIPPAEVVKRKLLLAAKTVSGANRHKGLAPRAWL